MPGDGAVLVVAPSWVGDLVLAEPLLRLLAQRPGCAGVDVLAAPVLHPLLARMATIRRTLPAPFAHGELRLAARRRLGIALRDAAYAQAVVLPGSFKSALVPWFAGIAVRTGYTGEARFGLLNDRRRLNRAALAQTAQRFLALGLAPGAPLPEPVPYPQLVVAPASIAATPGSLDPDSAAGPLAVLCPGAEYGPAKRWPARHFGAVAGTLHAQGWRVCLLGSARDRPVCAAVQQASGGVCLDLCGRTDLGQACDLLAGAALVVSNDSGLMHIAAALGRRVLGVFGSSDPRHTPPLGPHAQTVSLNLSCSPCFRRECPLGHLNCLEQLLPARVLQAAGV